MPHAPRERLLIVGNGMAAFKLMDELTRRASGRHAITVVGAEPHGAYNRVLLSSVLAGETSLAEIALADEGWYRARGITLLAGRGVVAIDAAARIARLDDGTTLGFDMLVLATGSEPIRLPVPGAELAGVTAFRDLADVAVLSAAVAPGTPAVVIGGGLLGIEAACGLRRLGADVTIVHLMDRLMERQLDAAAAGYLKRAVEARGIAVALGAATAALQGGGRVEAVALKDGRVLPAALVVFAAGIRPRSALARAAGLAVERGIVVDDRLETSMPGIFALGECAQHRGQVYGLVEPAHEQARVLAAVLCGEATAYPGSVTATNLKVSGVPVFSAGRFEEEAGEEVVVLADPGMPHYRKLVIHQGRLAGCVLFGETADGPWFLDLIRSGQPIAPWRGDLAFGPAYVDAA